MRPLLTASLAALALTACARSEEASQVPPDSNQGYNLVGRVHVSQEDDGEPSIGEWRAALQEERPALEFGPMGTDPLFSLLCAENGAVILQRHGGVPTGPLPQMRITIGGTSEEVGTAAGGGTIPMLRATIAASSPIGQALAGAPQQIRVRLADGTPLLLPASPLIGDYARGCARPGGPAAGNSAAPAPAGNAATPAPAPAPANTAQPAR